jgi:hypothetical protein
MLRKTWILLLPVTLVVHCGGGDTTQNDAGEDGGTDATVNDAANKDATSKDSTTDVVTSDVSSDVNGDVSSDAPSDAPTDAQADALDGGWTVTSITGLVLWLDANKGVTTSGSSISAWADQSGQSNDAASGTATPTLVSSSINSLPAAHFVSSSAQYVTITDATTLQWGTGDYYVAVVAKFDNNPDGGITTGIGALYTKLGSGSGALFFANDYNYALSIDGGTTDVTAGLSSLEDPSTEVQYAASYNDGSPRLYAVMRASGTETLRVNASQVASSTSSVDVTESGFNVEIGLMSSLPAAALDGDIAEVIAVKGTLSSTDLTNVESYLTTKYGL